MYNILICDDEQDIVNALKIYLSGGDYCLFEASNGREALEVVEKNDIHLILIDIMMPQLDGIAATAKLREKSNVPIILLTAKDSELDYVMGISQGSDDYLTKPFRPTILLMKVKALLRRVERAKVIAKNSENEKLLDFGSMVIDPAQRIVAVNGEQVHLTPTEFDLLATLARRPKSVLTREKLLEEVWDWVDASGTRTVDSHVKALRHKLGADTIRTVHGVGYAFEPPTA